MLHPRVNERNLQVSSAGDVVDATHICGRLLSCLSTFATVVWVFTKRRTVCFGEFCSPDEVGRFGRGHVVVGVVRRCEHWQTLGGSVLVVFFRRAGDTDLGRGPSKEHETETVDQHNINASSLFVACARSFGTAQIIHDGGHAPHNKINSVVFIILWSTNNVVSPRVHRDRLDVKPQRANRTMFLFGRR